MVNDIVLIDAVDGVATITMNRPETHNAFDEHMIASLSGKLDMIGIQDAIHTVVLRGAGKSFSAGADLNWMRRAATFTEAQNKADAMALANMLHKLYSLQKTTIACVQGAAFGGGMGLVSCCDIVIADRSARFALSEVRLGLIPATIAPYVLRAMGDRHARRYFQTAEQFDAVRAKHIGMVHEIVDDHATMESELQNMLSILEGNGPYARAEAKRLCLDFAAQPITPVMIADSASRIARIRAGDEAKEGLSAFIEKRKARWAGSSSGD